MPAFTKRGIPASRYNTSNLDTESESEVQNSIDSLRGNKTIVLIAHRLSTIQNCDTINVLKDGRIVEQGTYDSLYSLNGEFTQMVKHQALASNIPQNGHHMHDHLPTKR